MHVLRWYVKTQQLITQADTSTPLILLKGSMLKLPILEQNFQVQTHDVDRVLHFWSVGQL